LIWLPFTTLSAQKISFNVQFSTPVNLPEQHKKQDILAENSKGYWVLSTIHEKALGITRFSDDLKLQGQHVLSLPKVNYFFLKKLIQIEDRHYIAATQFDKKSSRTRLFLYSVDPASGAISENPLEIGPEVQVGTYYLMNNRLKLSDLGEISVTTSPEIPGFMLQYSEYVKPRGGQGTNDVYTWYDADIKKSWTQKITYNELKDFFPLNNVEFYTDNGLTRVSIIANSIDFTSPRQAEKVCIQHINGSTSNMACISIASLNASSVQVSPMNSKQQVLVTGLLPASDKQSISGYFSAILNLDTKDMEDIRKSTFSQSLIKNFHSEKQKTSTGIPALHIRKVIPSLDGGWYVIGEQYRIITSNIGGSLSSYEYLYGDIFVAKIDAANKEEYLLRIPRRQVFREFEEGGGLGAFEFNNKLLVFYNDNPANKNLAPDVQRKDYKKFSEGVFSVSEIDNSAISTHYLFSTAETHQHVAPKEIREITNGKYVFEAQSDEQTTRIGIITAK